MPKLFIKKISLINAKNNVMIAGLVASTSLLNACSTAQEPAVAEAAGGSAGCDVTQEALQLEIETIKNKFIEYRRINGSTRRQWPKPVEETSYVPNDKLSRYLDLVCGLANGLSAKYPQGFSRRDKVRFLDSVLHELVDIGWIKQQFTYYGRDTASLDIHGNELASDAIAADVFAPGYSSATSPSQTWITRPNEVQGILIDHDAMTWRGWFRYSTTNRPDFPSSNAEDTAVQQIAIEITLADLEKAIQDTLATKPEGSNAVQAPQ